MALAAQQAMIHFDPVHVLTLLLDAWFWGMVIGVVIAAISAWIAWR